jgi:hypothetical protein
MNCLNFCQTSQALKGLCSRQRLRLRQRACFTLGVSRRTNSNLVPGSPRTPCPNVNLGKPGATGELAAVFQSEAGFVAGSPCTPFHGEAPMFNIGLAFSEFRSEEFTRSVSWRMTTLLRDLPRTPFCDVNALRRIERGCHSSRARPRCCDGHRKQT